jgi:ribosomal RNA-processing protein 36
LYELQKNEVPVLKSSLIAARKTLATSPRTDRREKEEDAMKLERALKRAESGVQKWKKEERERKVLDHAVREERAKRTEGKRNWWMKESEKKKLLLKARFDALAEGGHRAVKKAIDKKRKKVAQKEKKLRPYARGQSTGISSPSVQSAGKREEWRDGRAGQQRNAKRRKLVRDQGK